GRLTGKIGGWLLLRASLIRALLIERTGNPPVFHLLRSAANTRAVRASDASEQFQFFLYSSTALVLPAFESKSRELSGLTPLGTDVPAPVPCFVSTPGCVFEVFGDGSATIRGWEILGTLGPADRSS